ncbi:MAG: 1-phosphofructokinase family hexose kinase [Anaerolineae bacterium]
MILCINANAAIDKTVIVRNFHLDDIQRPEQVLAIPGGKGINVARALKLLGDIPVVSGWVGGYAGQFIEDGLKGEGIQLALVHTTHESRTCLSILDPENNTLTELYEKGDPITPDKIDEFTRQFERTIGQYAAVTCSGSLPPGVQTDFYARLLEISQTAGVPGLLDSSGEPLKRGLAGHPILVKPNCRELAELVGRELPSIEHVRAAAIEVATAHDTQVVVSLGGEGALATDGSLTLHLQPPRVMIKSAVGSGDCLLAGIAYGLVHNFSLQEAVKYGVAAGTANALTIGAGNFTLKDFHNILSQVTITH